MTTPTPTPAVWSDGDPLMTAIAAAVSAQCQTHPEQGLTVDDPRTIAAVAATVARQVLGTPTTDPTPAAPLGEVWAVWREDEPIWAHCATVDDARQGTIDCWQEDEPACPDYSWDRQADGKRLELLVGGTRSGVYASRRPVYGAAASAPAAPADRAAVFREAYEIAHAEGMRLNALESEIGVGPYRGALGVAHLLRRLADEAQPTATATEAYPPAFPWATLMDDEDLAEFLAEIEHAVATPGATPAEALAAAEKACSTWRLIAEAQHGHNTAPGPAEERREPHPTEADMAHALALLDQLPATAATEAPPVVAYRDPNNPRVLLCREHGEQWNGVVPVTAEDLPDGGICTFGRLSSLTCGRDVLTATAATEEPQP